MKKTFYLIIVIVQFSFAQQRTCGKDQFMDRIIADPIAREKHFKLQEKFEVELAKLNDSSNKILNPTSTIYIPVAVHFPNVSTSSTCLINLAINQVNILNADYNARNSDLSKWTNTVSAFYPGTNIGNMDVQFVLATQNHPIGTGLVEGNKAVTFGTDFLNGDDYDTTWKGYMNIVCRSIEGSILGYSPLGGDPGDGATVVITNFAFGSGAGCQGYVPISSFNLGRTLTHELGHFLFLDHTFVGCTTALNCTTRGDKVCDTPASDAAEYGCPAAGSITNCSVKTLTMNYMDYVDDACMYMFTKDQATRMLAWYNTISDTFKTNTLSNNEFLANNFSISPNPSNGNLTIKLKNILNTYSIEVFDIAGRSIFEKKYSNNYDLEHNINIGSTKSGIYFISFESDNAVYTKKIIVK